MQTSYSINQSAALEGGLYDLGLDKDVVSGVSAAAVKIGKLVTLSAQDIYAAPAASGDVTAKSCGVVLRPINLAQDGLDSIEAKKPFNVLKKARVWVKPEDIGNFAINGAVNVRYAGTGDKGAFRCASVSSETAVLPNAKFIGKSGDLALIEINLV